MQYEIFITNVAKKSLGCIVCDSTCEGMHMHELMLFTILFSHLYGLLWSLAIFFQSCSCFVKKVSQILVTCFPNQCVFCITWSRPENTCSLPDQSRTFTLLPVPPPNSPDPSTALVVVYNNWITPGVVSSFSQVCYHFTTAAGGIHIALYVSHLQQ